MPRELLFDSIQQLEDGPPKPMSLPGRALLDVNENDPANAENEYTISDNNGGTIELSVEQAGNKKVATLRRSGLKLTIEKTSD